MKQQRDSFASSIGVFLALVGSAVGLGNIWRFPYMMGENGGAAFIIIYLFCAFFLAMPIMISEFVIGRRGQENAINTFKKITPGTKWFAIGLLGVLTAFLMMSFYSVIGGWTLDYFIKSLSPSFTAAGADFEGIFTKTASSLPNPVIFTLLFILISALIVSFGVQKGIEKSSKVMMPVLFILIILIAIRSITLPGAEAGLKYIFEPDFSKVTADIVLAALGQAFFSLSIGMGVVITYASYANKKENIIRCSTMTVIADTAFAIIAGCAIMPAVFVFGYNPSEGPGLVFITLPKLFSEMPMGGIIAPLFFFSLLIAAISSAISMVELMVSCTIDKFGVSRSKATVLNVLFLLAPAVLCVLSQGVLSDFKIMGMDLLNLLDFGVANILMTSGAFFIVLFVGWKMGYEQFSDEMTNRGHLNISTSLLKTIFFFIRYIAPAAILLIAVYSIIK